MTAAKTAHTGNGLVEPAGEMNQPRLPEFDGDNPSGTLSFSVYVCGTIKSMNTIIIMAIGTPKSPNARLALKSNSDFKKQSYQWMSEDKGR